MKTIAKKIILKKIIVNKIILKKIIVNEIRKNKEELSCQVLNNWNISWKSEVWWQ